MNNQPGDIRIYVRSEEYKAECTSDCRKAVDDKACWRGELHGHCADICHGTGLRTVRLAGLVCNIVINPVPGSYVSGIEGWIIMGGIRYCKTSKWYPEPFSSDPYEAFPIYKLTEELHGNIIEAHHAGTLPPELYREELPDGIVRNPMGLEETNEQS